MCRAQRPRLPPSIPPCSLPGLSAESGRSAGKDPKYLAPPRLPQGRLGGGTEGAADLNRLSIPQYISHVGQKKKKNPTHLRTFFQKRSFLLFFETLCFGNALEQIVH